MSLAKLRTLESLSSILFFPIFSLSCSNEFYPGLRLLDGGGVLGCMPLSRAICARGYQSHVRRPRLLKKYGTRQKSYLLKYLQHYSCLLPNEFLWLRLPGRPFSPCPAHHLKDALRKPQAHLDLPLDIPPRDLHVPWVHGLYI
jgi:hypothetical protein